MRAAFLIAAAALVACGGTPSTFDFTTSGDLNEHVVSDAYVTGEINNAGQLALDDGVWLVTMSLSSLEAGHDQAVLELTLIDKVIGERFSTTVGGTCAVTLDPHGTTNGDIVRGVFHCSGLASSDGKTIDIGFGEFSTAINDAANDPNLNAPYP